MPARAATPPGSPGRAHLADPAVRDELYRHFDRLRDALEASRPDALVVVAAEHFANFFFDNMPAYCVGMADFYEGPIEDEAWLAIERRRIPGAPELSKRLITAGSWTTATSPAPRNGSSTTASRFRCTS